jgi:hypothetical protein
MDAFCSYQLAHSLLAIEIEDSGAYRLVRIPATSFVKRTAVRSSLRGFVGVIWKGRTHLMFYEDLREKAIQYSPGCNFWTTAEQHSEQN